MALYADIIDIDAPGSAVIGSRVDITVKIRNLYPSTIGIMVGGALEYGVVPYPQITFPDDQENVAGGATHSFSGRFTMPSKDVYIHAYSYYYSSDDFAWHFDDRMTKRVVATEEPAPPPPPPEWYYATVRYLYVRKLEVPVPQWFHAVTRYLNVRMTEPIVPIVGWLYAVSKSITVKKAVAPPPVGWLYATTRLLTVKKVVVPVPPPEEVKFPWGVAAVVGGGAIALAAMAEAKKKKS